jgi:undecaprenyl-diphosphatase
MTDWITATLLGLVEGLTEFIPVSSTGHLLIAEQWLPRQSDLFNVVIQLGAVLALVPLFWAKLSAMIFGWRDPSNIAMLRKLALAFVITCVGGFILEKLHFKLPEKISPVAGALLVGGIIMILVETWCKKRVLDDHVTHTVAVAIAIGQLIAIIFPGASRSGSTIMLAMVLGLNRSTATEFTFMLSIPTMAAASGYKLLKVMTGHHHEAGSATAAAQPHENWSMLALCTVISFVVSYFVVRWLIRYVKSHSFNGFAIYRIAIGLLLFAAYAKGWIVDPPVE